MTASKRQLLSAGTALLLTLAAGLEGCRPRRSPPAPKPPAEGTAAQPPAVQTDAAESADTEAAAANENAATAAVTRTTLTRTVTAAGKIVANRDVEVKCKASGTIVQLPSDVCDAVKKGDLLAQLDPVDEQRKVRQAEIQLSVSRANLASAKENLDIAEANLAIEQRKAESDLKAAESNEENVRARAVRMQELLKGKLCSQEEYDNAAAAAVQAASSLANTKVRGEELRNQGRSLGVRRQDMKQAEAAVARDEIALSIAQDRLLDTKVAAPIDGVVTRRDLQVGQIIASATSNVGGGTPILTLSDLSRLFVLAPVREHDIGLLRNGLPVAITADAFPGRRFNGRVVRIAPCGETNGNDVTFTVKIEILDKEMLKPEMSATAEIIVERKPRVLAVPRQALRETTDGGTAVEVVQKDGKVVCRTVRTGLGDGSLVEILSGLKEGETVLLHTPAPETSEKKPETTPAASPPSPVNSGEKDATPAPRPTVTSSSVTTFFGG
jgi:multidrug efflux pump subunit AcrA (membrane-fusion protein)